MTSKKKSLMIAVIIGIIIRLILMVTTYHPDIRATQFASYDVVNQGHWVSFYDTLLHLPQDDPLYRSLGPNELNYPPLAYIMPIIVRLVAFPLYDPSVDWKFLTNVQPLFGQPAIFPHLFMLKLPNIIADLVTAWAITWLFTDFQKKRQAFLLWLFNPVTLYATAAIGQHDIWPTLCSIIAGIYLVKDKPVVSAIFLGIGGGYKLFPLLLLWPTAVMFGRRWQERLTIIFAGLFVYGLITLPFVFFSSGYRTSALMTPQISKMLFAKVNLSGDQYLSIFLVGFTIISWLAGRLKKTFWMGIWTSVLLLFFAVTHFHPQWFLWITPWLIFYWIDQPSLRGLIGCIAIFAFGITLSFDASLHIGLFSPLFPNLSTWVSPLPNLVSKVLPWVDTVSLVRSLLAGSAFTLGFRLLRIKLS